MMKRLCMAAAVSMALVGSASAADVDLNFDPNPVFIHGFSDSGFGYQFSFTNYLTPDAVNISFQGWVFQGSDPSGVTVTVSDSDDLFLSTYLNEWTVSNYFGPSSFNFGGLTAGADYWVTVGGDSNGSTGEYALALSPAPVPEPETYAMLLAGLGLLGVVARRRKQQAS